MFPRGIYGMKHPDLVFFHEKVKELGTDQPDNGNGTGQSPAFPKKRELSSSAIQENNRFNETILNNLQSRNTLSGPVPVELNVTFW
jgi:hypothetical protein